MSLEALCWAVARASDVVAFGRAIHGEGYSWGWPRWKIRSGEVNGMGISRVDDPVRRRAGCEKP